MIGNTELMGIPIPNAQVFVEQMQALGMPLEHAILREIPSKILPTTRDRKTGRFAATHEADFQAYSQEYILVFRKV
ncbi:MAG: hypothetical protein ACUVSV_16000 [Armatimonadota bacterium]